MLRVDWTLKLALAWPDQISGQVSSAAWADPQRRNFYTVKFERFSILKFGQCEGLKRIEIETELERQFLGCKNNRVFCHRNIGIDSESSSLLMTIDLLIKYKVCRGNRISICFITHSRVQPTRLRRRALWIQFRDRRLMNPSFDRSSLLVRHREGPLPFFHGW